MPFAGEFSAGMRLPRPGDAFESFVVESVDVEHVGVADGRYEYPLAIVVRGKGGKDGARRALRDVLRRRATIFSGYGNPYQCAMGTASVEGIGPSLYRVSARGVGTRVRLREELEKFVDWLARCGQDGVLSRGAALADPAARAGLAAEYMRAYQAEATFAEPGP